jgi:hypothetical protein
MLYQLALDGVIPDRDGAAGRMMYFDDALDLARIGMGDTEEEIVREMLEFLAAWSQDQTDGL